MIEAKFDPKEHKDWLGLAAELEAQGVKVEWSPSGRPSFLPSITYGYDAIERKFVIRQKPPRS